LTQLPTDFVATLTGTYGPLAERAIALYGARAQQPVPDPLHGTPVEQWAGDAGFRCDSVQQALWHAAAGHAAYQYEFSRVPPGRKSVEAIHTAEMWYVFGTLALGTAPTGPAPQYDRVDAELSRTMQQCWTNFARTGDPNGAEPPHWPRFAAARRAYLDLGDQGATSREGLRRPFCDLHMENLRRLGAP
jgi:para-nitrobenzyl esterase